MEFRHDVYPYTIEELLDRYAQFNQRTKRRIRENFDRHFKLPAENDVFIRVMNQRLAMNMYEYQFLVVAIRQNYEFWNGMEALKNADPRSCIGLSISWFYKKTPPTC